MTGRKKAGAEEVRVLAARAERQLNLIHRTVRQGLNAEFARGSLTGPQRLVMEVLVGRGAMSLKALSAAVSLAHSTVSGIVDRLEAQGMIVRTVLETDRRVRLIAASAEVTEFLARKMPELTLHPLVEAMGRATPEEREAVMKGVETLARLLGVGEKDLV